MLSEREVWISEEGVVWAFTLLLTPRTTVRREHTATATTAAAGGGDDDGGNFGHMHGSL